MVKARHPFIYLCIALFGPGIIPAWSADEYSFDMTEIAKKPYEFGGYAEFKPTIAKQDPDAALYRLRQYTEENKEYAEDYSLKTQVTGSYEYGIARIFGRINLAGGYTDDNWSDEAQVYEGYLSLKPSSAQSLDLGKKSFRWGKGYAWNPAAFIDRQKNPDDPELSLEGFVAASADYVRSFSGPLQALAITPAIIPVSDSLNDDFGKTDHLNGAGKIYLLLFDTDIDFIVLTGASKSTRLGADFARNITPAFEVHGEFAWLDSYQKKTIDSEGRVSVLEYDAFNSVLGTRYLTEQETTFIIEYYHNDSGYTKKEMADYFAFIDRAYENFQATGSTALLEQAAEVGEGGGTRINPMRDYLYTRISQKEPFDLLYYTPAITSIMNLNDGSYSLSPELVYTGITNAEIRLKINILQGEEASEYGEKPNDYLVELRLRYFF